ncbi:MAG: RNA methyltransferase [Paludibacteraceae bacterium]|nr:RNA methyltransferase [Paludibacteraceae bacterium]
MVLSKNKIKYFNSLNLKKNRDNEQVFIAEGIKLVGDLLPYFKAKYIVATTEWLSKNSHIADEIIEIENIEEMKKITLLSTPSSVYVVFYRSQYDFNLQDLLLKRELILALDTVQDPGNLGTIIRIADWFGIKNIICSHGTVDVYNAKTIQSTMGALARVKVHYVELRDVLDTFRKQGYPIYGTFLDGASIYNTELAKYGIIVMGNEGNGISDEIAKLVSDKLLIPSYPADELTSESLNVAVATAIVCSEFRRR